MPSPRLLVRNPSVLQSNNVEHAQLSMVFFLLMLCFQPFRVGLVWHSTAFGSLSCLRNIFRIHFGNPSVKKYVEFNLCHKTEAPGQCGVELLHGYYLGFVCGYALHSWSAVSSAVLPVCFRGSCVGDFS